MVAEKHVVEAQERVKMVRSAVGWGITKLHTFVAYRPHRRNKDGSLRHTRAHVR